MVFGAAMWWAVPQVSQEVRFFRVRRIELVGLKHLTPGAVIDGLRLSPSASIFDDLAPLRARAGRVPGVASAAVERRWPGTIRVTLAETAPVAVLSAGSRMVAIDARGRRLPFDPAASAPDLPVVATADAVVAGFLGRVQDSDMQFFSGISAAWRVREDVVLEIGGRRVWLRPDASREVLRAVTAVTEDLVRKRREYRELDGRFAGQVIVRGRGA